MPDYIALETNLNIENKITPFLNRFLGSNNQFYIFDFNFFLPSDFSVFIGSMKIYVSVCAYVFSVHGVLL